MRNFGSKENGRKLGNCACVTFWSAARIVPLILLTTLLLLELYQSEVGGLGLPAGKSERDVKISTGAPQRNLNEDQLNAVRHALMPYGSHVEDERNITLSHFAIALKTGGDVAATRLPVIKRTWLRHFENVLVIGDRAEEIDGMVVNDVVTGQTGVRSSKKGSDGVKTVEDSDGWKNDAFKNIPGFNLLYKKFPDAQWYLMVDDDTYIYIDNLIHFVRDKDPNQTRYSGAGTKFVGCDGVTEYGKGPRFAHGGSGILLSRATMKSVFAKPEIMEECAKKYRTCMFGDVRVALCLRDHKVFLTPHEGFNNRMYHDTMAKTKWTTTSPCLRPVTQHKMAPHQLLSAYEAEAQAHKQRLFVDLGYLRTLQFAGGGGMVNETVWTVENRTLLGSPYASFSLASAADCGRACEVLTQCVQWEQTAAGLCKLFDRQTPSRFAKGHVAGRAFVCRAVLEEKHNELRGHRWVYQMQTGQEMLPSMWDI